MRKVHLGDTVKVHYTGKLEGGKVLATSKGKGPLLVNIGSRRHIPGFEKSLVGMEPGETKTITVPPEEAHGPKRKELIVKGVPKNKLPQNMTPATGKAVWIEKEDGDRIEMTITEVGAKTVTLDANHPLAGKTLIFDVRLVEVV
jgi:FKBP-type peptidyl-prolyl cis-trans isomerase 2